MIVTTRKAAIGTNCYVIFSSPGVIVCVDFAFAPSSGAAGLRVYTGTGLVFSAYRLDWAPRPAAWLAGPAQRKTGPSDSCSQVGRCCYLPGLFDHSPAGILAWRRA